MPTYKISFGNLIRQLLPHFKVLPKRMWWLGALLAPLQEKFNEFNTYRDNTRMMMRVTSQIKMLEGYLQRKYSEMTSIKVVSFDDGAMLMGLEEEALGVYFSYDESEGEGVEVPLEGEMRSMFDDVDFIVYIPTTIEITDVIADIEQFKLANVKYKITQQ